KRLKSDQKATVKEKLDQVTKISHNNPIMVGGYKEDPWNTSSCDIRTLIVDEIMHKDLNSWWFPTGALEETECFLFLKQLLGKTNNRRVIIADPYFSSLSLASFFPVLKNLQAEYTVLTGLFGRDPDTNQESDVETEKKKFVQLCEKNSGFLPAKLTIINAAKSQKPLFHDRYILIYNTEGRLDVYTLSNSLNRAAGLYPMCITKLEPGTAEHVSEYVKNLLNGHYPDQNGNLQDYKPEEIWSTQKSQQAVSTPKKLITENGPEDYFCWDSFWGKLFNLSDKQKLLNELKKKAIIKKQGDQFIWDIEPENLAEMIEVKPDKTVSFSENELTLFIIGLGETLARTTSDKENFDLYVWLNNKKSIYNTKLYSSVSKYYENLTYHPFSRQDLSLQVLIESRIFDIDLVTNCLHLLDYPLFPGRTKWGFSHLMDQAIDHDHENFFKWASLKSGFLDFHIQLINRMRYIGEMPDDIYPFLLKNDSPFFKALAVASLLKEINHNSTDYTVNDFIEILQSSDYADTDILWILSSRASGYMLGNTADEEKKKNTEAYLKGLLPLYTDYLSDSQQKNLVSALKNIEIIHIFAKLTANEYQDQGKTLFLWKACVEQFDNKLEEDRFYAGGDINLLLEISGEALINSNPGIPVDQIFVTKYQNNWDSIVDELIIPFSYRDHGFCYKSIGNSIFLLYVGYVVLILDAEVTSNGNKELELYLYDQILKLAGIEVGLKGWPDHTKSGILNRVINLVTHYYRSYGQIAVKDDINKIIEDIKSALIKKSEENPNE
ncbi:MAG: hypothetical protein KAR21_15045, partial [Spirochaetales bacterium]|nr:hypothetical protein [Spirochaetales bacterium]